MDPREFIGSLSNTRPDYVLDARIRADTLSSDISIPCPKCNRDMQILHIFPQLESHEDPLIDTDWHLKCLCGHEDIMTITKHE